MNTELRLYLNFGKLGEYEPLPVRYLGVPEVREMTEGWLDTDCRRCEQPWSEHQWVLFINWRDPIDCSLRPRTALR